MVNLEQSKYSKNEVKSDRQTYREHEVIIYSLCKVTESMLKACHPRQDGVGLPWRRATEQIPVSETLAFLTQPD